MRAPKQISIGDQEIDLEKIIADTLEKLLAPVVEEICQMERIRRKEYLTEKEVALLFSLSAATLKTQRSRGEGLPYIKKGKKVIYRRTTVTNYLLSKEGF